MNARRVRHTGVAYIPRMKVVRTALGLGGGFLLVAGCAASPADRAGGSGSSDASSAAPVLSADAGVPAGVTFAPIAELSDEFDGTALDETKWTTFDPNWAGRPPALFDPAMVSLRGGELWIAAEKLAAPREARGRTWTHLGALVGSHATLTPGTFTETRMRPNATFMSSTFWMMAYPTETPEGLRAVELDVVECVGVDSRENDDDPAWTKNWGKKFVLSLRNQRPAGRPRDHLDQVDVPVDGTISDRFYTFGCWWVSEHEARIYLDGEEVARLRPRPDLPYSIPMRLRMVVETYDHNPPPPPGHPGALVRADGTPRPLAERATRYDYVRSWRVAAPGVRGSGEDRIP